MPRKLADFERQLDQFDAEIAAAREDATARLAGTRRVKLGDLSLREGLYEEMKSVLRKLCHDSELWSVSFRDDDSGTRLRRLLLVFMSEMVYWEYEHSFWEKLYQVLEVSETASAYRWLTTQMLHGYKENGISLIRTGHASRKRREFVQTIIRESGFSRRLVQQAKQFVLWFFDNYSTLDPRTLDKESFDRILDKSDLVWNKEELFELLREMIGDVSRLLREIRKRSLTSADLRDDDVLAELEAALGFHPIRGIFGFRNHEDIQQLVEQLSTRVRPVTLYALLHRKLLGHRGTLWVTTPDGQYIEVHQPRDVPIVFGEYLLITPERSEVQVVPREALTIRKLANMLQHSKQKTFHPDSSAYAWIYDDQSFEVYQGTAEPEEPYRYYIDDHPGYLWYGKQRIGIPLRAERDGQVIAELDPRRDVWLNPRLRLSQDGTGLLVVIPSFVCYKPEFAGQTVQLELNGRLIGNTTYVVGRNGALQFQSTRSAMVQPEDKYLEVRLVTADGKHTLAKRPIPLKQALLFNAVNRELISSGSQHYGGSDFVLFVKENHSIETGAAIRVEFLGMYGSFRVIRLRWTPDSDLPQPFELGIGDQRWRFEHPLEVSTSLFCAPIDGYFHPYDQNAAFDVSQIQIRLRVYGHPGQANEIWSKLSLIIEKDGEFLTDFTLAELQSEEIKALRSDITKGDFIFDVGGIINGLIHRWHLTDRQIGTYRWTLALRPDVFADLETVSEMEFVLLPALRAEGIDVPMIEGEESLITVFCDAPLLAEDEDRSTEILRINCKPQAFLDSQAHLLKPDPIERTVRLIYPPTKVALKFIPQLFAARVVSHDKALPQPMLTYGEAKASFLTILAPPNETVRIGCVGLAEQITVDSGGYAKYGLNQLLHMIEEEATQVDVSWGNTYKKFQIVWYPTLQYDPDRCHFKVTGDGCGILTLVFRVEGPPRTDVSFNLTDNRLRFHGTITVRLADLKQGMIDLPVDLHRLQGATMLFCAAFAAGQKIDSVQVLCKDIDRSSAQHSFMQELDQIAAKVKVASVRELLDWAVPLETLEQTDLLNQVLSQMYSTRCLDQVYEQRNSMTEKEVSTYFRWFRPNMLSEPHRIPVAKLKQYGVIPAAELRVACAENLILRNDGVGVEEIIDLMASGQVSWDRGFQALSKNRKCASEAIRDIVQWDDLEAEEDEYIKLMERLAQSFHPPMARQARAARDWKRAIALRKSQEIFEASVINSSATGLVVPFGMIIGNVPAAEIDRRRHNLPSNRAAMSKRLAEMINASLKLVVAECNRKTNLLVLSEKRAMDKLADLFLARIKQGDILEGIITAISNFGIFVDLGDIDGLIHVSEVSWDKSQYSNQAHQIGEKVRVYVMGIDREHRRVSLSLRRLSSDYVIEKYVAGQQVKARVVRVTDSGASVIVEEKVDGFVHVSELTTSTITHPRQVVHEGQSLVLRVLHVDKEKHRLDLSLRQLHSRDLYWGAFRIKT